MDDYFIPSAYDTLDFSVENCRWCDRDAVCVAEVTRINNEGNAYEYAADLCINHLHLADDLLDDAFWYVSEVEQWLTGSAIDTDDEGLGELFTG